MSDENLTRYSAAAQQSKEFTLLLRDGTAPFSFRIERNGQVIEHTGQLTLFCNPEELVKDWPARNNVTQTPHGVWVDSFGPGLPRWTLNGTTGWRARRRDIGLVSEEPIADGYLAFHAFHDMVQTYFEENQRRARESLQPSANKSAGLLSLVFIDHADDDMWMIEPEGVPTKRRSKNSPLTIEYTFRFTGIQNLKEKTDGPADPTGTALVGSPERLRRILESGERSTDDLRAAYEDWVQLELDLPAETAEADDFFNLVTDLRTDGRVEVNAMALEFLDVLLDAEGLGTDGEALSPGMSAALDAAKEASEALAERAGLDDLDSIADGTTDLTDTLQTIQDAPIVTAGDQIVRDALTVDKLEEMKDAAERAKDSAFSSVSELGQGFAKVGAAVRDVVTKAETIFGSVRDFMDRKTAIVTSTIGGVSEMVDRIRGVMQGVGFLISVSSQARRLLMTLRLLRTRLRNLLCSVQSILNFPENFEASLHDTLEGIKALFTLSGCATSFPNLKGVSW